MYSRKFIALVLAFALLAFPVLSLGEAAPKSFLDQAFEAGRSVKTTVTFTPGDMLTQDPTLSIAADLLKVLKVEASKQKQGDTALEKVELFLQDKSSLDFSFLKESGQFHILSNLLGGQVLSFTPEEFVTFYTNMMESMAKDVPGFDAKMLESMKASIAASMSSSMQASKGAPKDLKDIAGYMELDPDSLQKDLVDPIIAWYTDITSKPEVTQGTFESEKHDPAVTQKVYTISTEQVKAAIAIFSNWATKDQNLDWFMKKAASSGGNPATLSKEELRAQLAAAPEEFAKGAASTSQSITITELLDAQGATKAFEVKAEVASAASTDAPVSVVAGKYVKTGADGVTTLYSLDTADGQDTVALTFTNNETPDATEGDTTVVSTTSWQLAGSAKSSGTETMNFSLGFDCKKAKSVDTTQEDWKLDITVNAGGMPLSASFAGTEKSVLSGVDAKADGKVDISVLGAPALTINYTTASGDPAALPSIPDGSVRLGKMTQEELNAWGQDASTVAMGQLMGLMSNLPPSILALFSGNQ